MRLHNTIRNHGSQYKTTFDALHSTLAGPASPAVILLIQRQTLAHIAKAESIALAATKEREACAAHIERVSCDGRCRRQAKVYEAVAESIRNHRQADHGSPHSPELASRPGYQDRSMTRHGITLLSDRMQAMALHSARTGLPFACNFTWMLLRVAFE